MTLPGNLLEYLITHRYTLAILTLSYGIAYLSFLIACKSQFSRMAWIMQIELAVLLIVMGALHSLRLYGVKTGIAFGLAGWLFFFAVMTTLVIYLINMSRGSRRG